MMRQGYYNQEFIINRTSTCLFYQDLPFAEDHSELKPKEELYTVSLSSYEVTVPCSKRSILQLLQLIIPPKPIPKITNEEFSTQRELFELIKQYFCDNWDFNESKLNDLIGKDGS